MELPGHIVEAVREAMGFRPEGENRRVVVAMSGGVDSSVTAALLRIAGYGVVGITLQLYDHGEATRRRGACCAGQDIHDARRVAADLDIPHYVLDYESRFRNEVIDAFVESYMRGETPIPCVNCNQSVKFADLLATSEQLDAAALATGHYVMSRDRQDGSGNRELLTPRDLSRDQSYFLYATTQAQVNFLRFPLGALSKQETRAAAMSLGLSVAHKPDSQDICFVPDGRYQDIILRLKPDARESGEIVHSDGRMLGRHDGVMNFTVGQRRGLGLSEGEPLYVLRIDAANHRVIVGPKVELLQRFIPLKRVNWLGDESITVANGRRLYVKVRSTRPPAAAMLQVAGEEMNVILDEPEPAVAPGQACVFYERPGCGARILGGGIIGQEAALGGDATTHPTPRGISLKSECV
jgi:tRNA-specific 2-thiouridylase